LTPAPHSARKSPASEASALGDIMSESRAPSSRNARAASAESARNGTTTLFAALDVLEGKVVGRCMSHHRHQDFIKFLNAVERAAPPGKVIHAILDNYATHKHPKVQGWLANHPRWVFHFTPTSASWLNAVEGFFSILTRRRLERGIFKSVADLEAAIAHYIREHNKTPKPFVWTKTAKAILTKLQRLPVPSE
jgi:transposase